MAGRRRQIAARPPGCGYRVVACLVVLCAGQTLLPAAAAAGGVGVGVGALPQDIPTPRAGDVVLRHGHGLWSRLFARLNRHDQRFSHAGIVVRDTQWDTQRQWRVVHAEVDDRTGSGRVRIDAWHDFVDQSAQVALLRVGDERVAARMADAAVVMHRDALAFDLTFDLSRTDAVYCTELVWRALTRATGRDPLPVKPRVNGREVVLIENLLHDIPDLTVIYVTE